MQAEMEDVEAAAVAVVVPEAVDVLAEAAALVDEAAAVADEAAAVVDEAAATARGARTAIASWVKRIVLSLIDVDRGVDRGQR